MTVHRARPSVYYTPLDHVPWRSQNNSISAQWVATLERNTLYHKLVAYGEGEYVGDAPHTHRGKEDAHLYPVTTLNFIETPLPGPVAIEGEKGRWQSNGFGAKGEGSGSGSDRHGTPHGQIAGSYLEQILWNVTSEEWARPAGSGLDVVASFYLRSTVAPTRGGMLFGFTYGGSSKEEYSDAESQLRESLYSESSGGDYREGSRALVHSTDLPDTAWRRVWAVFRNVGGDASGDIRFRLRIAESFDSIVHVSGFMVNPGRTLYPFQIGPAELTIVGSNPARTNSDNRNSPTDVPVRDWVIGMDDAVQLGAF